MCSPPNRSGATPTCADTERAVTASTAVGLNIEPRGPDHQSAAHELRVRGVLSATQMGFYAEQIVPHLIAFAMRNPELAAYRQRIVPAARGRVLEIGIGSGLNLPLYGPGVTEIIGLDPSPKLIAMAAKQSGASRKPLSFLRSSAEAIPLDAGCVDTVVTT